MVVVLAGLGPFPVLAGDLPATPRLGWSLAFGGAGPAGAPALLLALDAPDAALHEAAPSMARLDLAASGASLRLAGLPLWQQRYRLGQSTDPADAPAAD